MRLNSLKKIIIVWILISVISLAACKYDFSGYSGEHPDMYSVAIYSLPGVRGYYNDLHNPWQPRLKVLESDEHGRVLFVYCEDEVGKELSLLIMQKSDDVFAYYYLEKNYIIKNASNGKMFGYGNDWDSAIASGFSDADKKDLKESNDWGTELDESRCVKVQITRKK